MVIVKKSQILAFAVLVKNCKYTIENKKMLLHLEKNEFKNLLKEYRESKFRKFFSINKKILLQLNS